MTFEKFLHMHSTKVIAIALCLALAMVSLAACSGQEAADEGSSPAPTEQTAAIDPSSWATLGDALATQTESLSSGWDDNYYVSMFKSGDSIVRVVAAMDAETSKSIDEVDWSAENVSELIDEAAGGLKLVSAEDLTGELVSQDELDGLVGKTGQELVDDGWVFESYFMYGGDETGATFAKGQLAYSFTFDASVAESDTEDGGASIMDAPLVSAEFMGASEDATDPTKVD